MKDSNKLLLAKARKYEKEARYQKKVMDSVEEISSLMSYKLADMVNITLEEGTYFKSEEWCKKNKNKLLVEHD